MHLRPATSCLALTLLLSACSASTSNDPAPAAPATPGQDPTLSGNEGPASDAALASSGLDPAAMDRSADACTDFYQFACGKWLEQTEIPADEGSWVRSFNGVRKRNEAELKRILEAAAQASSAASAGSKIGTFYAACMDEAAVDAVGAKPIAPLLAKAAKVKDARALTALLIELHALGIWPFFDLSPVQDPKDATRWAAQLDQGGLGLPDRDYYLKQDEASAKMRATYLEHVRRMLVLSGRSEALAKAGAADVLKIETKLAEISKSRVERRDPKTMYNRRARAELERATPAFAWGEYFDKLGLAGATEVYLTAPKFFEGLQPLFSAAPAALGAYLEWQIVRGTARHLSKPFVDESFTLEQALSGQAEIRPRWRRCVSATTAALRDQLGQAYVEANFSAAGKDEAEELVHAISAAFDAGLAALTWMDDATRTRAKEKLSAMKYLIGYPDKWRTYDFDVERGDYAGNVLRGREFDLKRELAKIGQSVDRQEWYIGAASVNAYYDPQLNHMAFPAGILQPPFYDVKRALPVNLGAIGIVLGHELTHGFDDEGAQYDAKGNLENWWSPAVGKQFDEKTSCVADQYSAYETLPGVHLNGRLTLGENIADLGGVKLAFAAYRALQSKLPRTPVVESKVGDQQFFLSVGQTWCAKYRPELAQMLARVDPHSPPRFRLQGPLSNMPEFATAFSCPAGAPMEAKNACVVW
jgi:putative endopeptidase